MGGYPGSHRVTRRCPRVFSVLCTLEVGHLSILRLAYLTYLVFREPLTLFPLTTTVIILLVAIKVDS